MSPAARERQRKQVRAWFKAHPTYYKDWCDKNKVFKAQERAKHRAEMAAQRASNLEKSKLAYRVNVTNPLTEEEKQNGKQKKKSSASSQLSNVSHSGAVRSDSRAVSRPYIAEPGYVHVHNEHINPTSVPRLQ